MFNVVTYFGVSHKQKKIQKKLKKWKKIKKKSMRRIYQNAQEITAD
jgi:hypothetical protein